MNYWLIKTEPSAYGIDNLKRDKKTLWTGVRNYQARNFLRAMKVGDKALFYHSGEERAVVGTAKVIKEAESDPTAYDKKDYHFDPKSKQENPTWFAPSFEFAAKFNTPVFLGVIKIDPKLSGIVLAQRGSRLSIQPVSNAHFEHIVSLGTT
jgi:predicted RNA-binding protein with PUA-like domain